MRIDEMTIDDVGIRPSRLQLPALLAIDAAGRDRSAIAAASARADGEDGHGLRGHPHRNCRDARPLGRDTARPAQALGDPVQPGRRQDRRVRARRARCPRADRDPSRSDASRSNPSTSPACCECRRCSRTRRSRLRPIGCSGCFRSFEGVEVKGVAAPFKNTGKPVNIDAFGCELGPALSDRSRARRVLTAKMTTPARRRRPIHADMLVAAGIDHAAIDLDLGAAWTEATRSFVVDAREARASACFEGIRRGFRSPTCRGRSFRPTPPRSIGAAAQIEAGAIELTLRDLGGVDLAVRAIRPHPRTSAATRRGKAIVDGIRASSERHGRASIPTP